MDRRQDLQRWRDLRDNSESLREKKGVNQFALQKGGTEVLLATLANEQYPTLR